MHGSHQVRASHASALSPCCCASYTYVITLYMFLQQTKKEPWRGRALNYDFVPQNTGLSSTDCFSRIQQWPVERDALLKRKWDTCSSSQGALSFEATSYLPVKQTGPADLLRKWCLFKVISNQENSTMGKRKSILGEWVFWGVCSTSMNYTEFLPVLYFQLSFVSI